MKDFNSDSSRWCAVQTRDRSAHSAFVYVVVTTKIVCRPTCPSRLARRGNVRYYDTTTEALLDGFRSCKRCQPELPAEMDHDKFAAIMTHACKLIHDANGHIKLTRLAAVTGFSTRHLHNVFKAKMGCTPAAYAAQVRQMADELDSSVAESSNASHASPITHESPYIEDHVHIIDTNPDIEALLDDATQCFDLSQQYQHGNNTFANSYSEVLDLQDHISGVQTPNWAKKITR